MSLCPSNRTQMSTQRDWGSLPLFTFCTLLLPQINIDVFWEQSTLVAKWMCRQGDVRSRGVGRGGGASLPALSHALPVGLQLCGSRACGQARIGFRCLGTLGPVAARLSSTQTNSGRALPCRAQLSSPAFHMRGPTRRGTP